MVLLVSNVSGSGSYTLDSETYPNAAKYTADNFVLRNIGASGGSGPINSYGSAKFFGITITYSGTTVQYSAAQTMLSGAHDSGEKYAGISKYDLLLFTGPLQ